MSPFQQHISRLFRLGGQYTKTDMRYVISGGFWLGISQIGIGLIAFGLSIAFANYVSKEVYGTYRYLLAIFWTIAAFSFSGIATAMARAVARGMEGAYRRSFKLLTLGCLPIAGIGIGGALYYTVNENMLLAGGMLLIALIGTFWQPSFLFGSFLEGKRAFRMNTIFGIAVNLVPALALLVTMTTTENPIIFLAVYLAGSVVTGAVLSLLVFRLYKPNTIDDPTLGRTGFHLSANNVLATFAGQADELLMYHFLGPIAVATYSFATALPDQIKNVANSIGVLAFPKFASRPLNEIIPTLGYRLALFTLMIGVLVGLYWLVAPLLFQIFFPAYIDSIWYSQIYALALIPASNIIPTTLLQAQAAQRELYILNTAGSIVQIVILAVCIATLGLWGAVLGRFATRTFSLVLSFVLVLYRGNRTTNTTTS